RRRHTRFSRDWSSDVCSSDLFGAERVTLIDAEYADFIREEPQLFQRQFQVLVLRMAFHINVELRGEELASKLIAFQLGDVHAVGRKSTQRLVERCRHVAHAEYKRGENWLLGRTALGPLPCLRQP